MASAKIDPNTKLARDFGQNDPVPRVSLGNPDMPNPKNTQTVKTRGTGAATRGNKSSTKLG